MNLSSNIRNARRSINFSQQQMADAVRKKVSTYRTYEEGRAEPSLATLIRITELVGVTLDELVRGNCRPSDDIRHRYERLSPRDRAIVDAVFAK